MTTPDNLQQERQSQLSRLLDAVKQCQVRFGGKTELATEWDSRVACLCSAWELALQHGMKHNNKALSTLKQVTELTGLTKVTGIGILHDLQRMETEPVFWHYVKEHLNKHEQQRFHMLKSIKTDAGRGRAWLRAAMNEHTLEKYLHMLLESDAMISQYYEDWAFLRDQERSSMLPTMAAGLGSILFAIKIDNHELNSIKAAVGLETIISTSAPVSKMYPPRLDEEPLPVFAGEGSPGERKVQKKKKKLVTIVSFEEDGSSSYTASPVTTPRSPSSGIDLANITSNFSGFYSAPLPTSPTAIENPNPGNLPTSIDDTVLGNTFTDTVNSEQCVSFRTTDSVDVGSLAVDASQPKAGETSAAVEDRSQDQVLTETHLESPSRVSVLLHAENSVTETNSQSENQNLEHTVVDGNINRADDVSNQRVQDFADVVESANQTAEKSDTEEGGMGTAPVLASSNAQVHASYTVDNDTPHDITRVEVPPEAVMPSDHSMQRQMKESLSIWLGESAETSKSSAEGSQGISVKDNVEQSVANDDPTKSDFFNVGNSLSKQIIETSSVVKKTDTSSLLESSYVKDVFSFDRRNDTKSALHDTISWSACVREDSVAGSELPDKTVREYRSVSQSKTSNVGMAAGSVSSSSSQSSLETNNIHGVPEVHDNLTPLTADGSVVFGGISPLTNTYDSVSVDSSDVASYSADTEHAAFALSMVQKGIFDSQGLRTQGDGSYTPEPISPGHETMSAGELKQAVVAMMLRKEEVEQENKSLRGLLDQEIQAVNGLRLEMDEVKKTNHQIKEKDDEKMKALTRENELLKHQLKKYVNAVQMLRREGQTQGQTVNLDGIHVDDIQEPMPPKKLARDYSFEASEYEKKLVQVAEMHGELMEFNELLHRQLNQKEAVLSRLRQELVDLRGPLPMDLTSDDNSSINSDYDVSSINSRGRPLISIWIPSAFMRGQGSDSHHIYQVYVRIRDEEWNVYRRYAEFYDLHSKLKKSNPVVNTFHFPPKKALGNKQARFVEDRRKKLQHYLRQVINLLMETSSDFSNNVSKQTLIQSVAFFGDVTLTNKKSKEQRRASAGGGRGQTQPHPAADQYMGL